MQIDFISFNKVLAILLNFSGIVIALSVLSAGKKNKTNFLFFIWVILMFAWIDLDFLSAFAKYIFPEDSVSALATFSSRLSWFFVSLYMIGTYYFVKSFPWQSKETKITKYQDIFYIGVWSLWAVLSLTPWVVSNVTVNNVIAEQHGGILQIPLLIFLAFAVIHYYYIMFKKYLSSEKGDKKKLTYFFIGSGVFAFLILIFNIIMPILAGGKYQGGYYIYGEYSSLAFLLFTAYAITKEQLFGLRVVLTQLLVIVMGSLLFSVPFLVGDTIWLQGLTWFIFALFCLLGYILIRKTASETAQKYQLEEEVDDRIEELEGAKKTLEEAKAVLEIRVQARTKELQEQTESLDRKVKDQTQELELKLEELERANKLMVGREVVMGEMKKEISQCKLELEKYKR